MSYLIDAGVEMERMEAVGFGPDQPIAANDSEDDRALNRRVVLPIVDLIVSGP